MNFCTFIIIVLSTYLSRVPESLQGIELKVQPGLKNICAREEEEELSVIFEASTLTFPSGERLRRGRFTTLNSHKIEIRMMCCSFSDSFLRITQSSNVENKGNSSTFSRVYV